MSKSLKLVVRNSKRTSISEQQSRAHSVTPLSLSKDPSFDFEEKLNQLQGNLRMLERRYRSNLKEGFDNKIKAYRLQAVVERRLLKEAIEETQRANEREQIREKLETNERERRLEQSRALMAQFQRQQRAKFIKQRNFSQKRGHSLTMHERKASIDNKIRQVHDKIIEEQTNINKKREYFDFIRRNTLKKQQLQSKKQILVRIVSNTQRLRDLKNNLQDLKGGQHKEDTFLTI